MRPIWGTATPGRAALLAVALICGLHIAPGGASAAETETAALPPADQAGGVGRTSHGILQPHDLALYREIFALQATGDWRSADDRLKRLRDPVLLGHVLFQRYMHPTAYRSSFRDLRSWLERYADHPGAERVHALALRRKPASAKAPPEPAAATVPPLEMGDWEARKPPATERREAARSPKASRAELQVRSLVRRERPTQALAWLQSEARRSRIDTITYDRSLAVIARGYYHAQKDEKALDLATAATARSGVAAPTAAWWGGLAAWRLNRYDEAAALFASLAQSTSGSEWTTAAAAYWAARAELLGGRPDRVNAWLVRAAEHPFTFYGLLAVRALGENPDFDWTPAGAGVDEGELLARIPAARRALALMEVGEFGGAQSELKPLLAVPSLNAMRAVLALAETAQIPDLALRLGQQLQSNHGTPLPAALFPVPGWVPEDGFELDRALIFAFIRQESRFDVAATSPAGARGLMQLMPATASYIAGESLNGRKRERLYEAEYNIALGQKYLGYLLEDGSVNRNLFYAATAYNAGPGTLQKWLRDVRFDDDPLLFIESIRAQETREFVERVLTNLWLYRLRLGQPVPSLDAVVAGEWPIYIPLDNDETLANFRAD